MKKLLVLTFFALVMVACGQKDDKKQEQPEQKEVYVPQGVPVSPMRQIPVQEKGTAFDNGLSQSTGPVLKLEEGKPLDFSQLNGKRKTLEEQATEQIDSIRYHAEQGRADYQNMFGVCYENGWGVDKDVNEAYKWYIRAANQDNPAACNSLGNFYRMGTAVKADPAKAFEWYKKGAAGGDAQAMLNLGNCYFYGMGIAKDEKTAIRWWTDAADAGNAYALSQMGDSYYFGIGVTKDLRKAVEYYQPAADKNISSAQYRLGLMYYTGEGVQQDPTYAKLLMTKARDGGMKEAQDFLDRNFK
ncbi:MAG: sel1 repeat family protein [Bacteroidales bacterium]|nr:sel1 repeat family protein [Bacteroidales bacterium]